MVWLSYSSSDGVTFQPQLGDDVLRQVGLDPLVPSGLTLGRPQQLIKLLRVKLETLEQPGGPGHDQQQLLDEACEVGGGLRRLVSCLHQQLLLVLGHLVEVARAGDELVPRLGHTVPGHLEQLVVDKPEDGDVVMIQLKVVQILVVLGELVEFLLHLLGGLGKPLLVEIVHQNDLIVNQWRADGRAEIILLVRKKNIMNLWPLDG